MTRKRYIKVDSYKLINERKNSGVSKHIRDKQTVCSSSLPPKKDTEDSKKLLQNYTIQSM